MHAISSLRSRFLPLLTCLIAASTILAATGLISVSEYRRQAQEERLHALHRMSTVRARLEGTLTAKLLLLKSIVSYISINGDIDHQTFQSFAEGLVAGDRIIRNVTLLKNTTIIDVYPLKGQEKALGVDLALIPEQRDTIRKAIETREPVIAGPVDLVQGGVGIVSRIPIFLTAPGGSLGEGPYWGQTSVVIMPENLFQNVKMTDPSSGLKYALRGKDGLGSNGAIFWGDETVFHSDPVIMDVTLPGGTWQMAAIPVAGWGSVGTSLSWIFTLGISLSLVAGWTTWSLFMAKERLQEQLNVQRSLMEIAQQSETRYRTLFESANDAMLLIRGGKITECNASSEKIFGCEAPLIVEKALYDFAPSLQPSGRNSREELQEKMHLALLGKSQFFEEVHSKYDGTSFDAEVSLTRIDMEGESIIQATIRDVADRKAQDQALTESEDRYREITENSLTGIFIHQDGIGVYANKRLADMLGYRIEEMIGEDFFRAVHPEDRETVNARVQARLRGELTPVAHELRLRKRTGEELWCEVLATRIEYRGHPAIMGNLADITERKEAEQALRRQADFTRCIFNSTDAHMAVVAADGKILDVNEAWKTFARQQGAGDEEQWGVGANYFLTFPDKILDDDLVREAFQGIQRVQQGELEHFTIDYPCHSPEEKRWFSMRVYPLTGHSGTVLVAHSNITDRRMAEEALRESEQFLRQTEQIARVGGWKANPITNTLTWTQGVYHIVEAPPDVLPNLEEGLRFYSPEYIPLLKEMLTNTLENDTSHSLEAEVITTSGKRLWAEVRSLRRVGVSGELHVMGTFQDVTERKQLEEDHGRLAAAIDQAAECVLITDRGGRVVYVNPAFEVTTGYSREEIIGQNPRILKSGVHAPSFYADLWNTISSGNIWRGRLTNRRKDGTLFHEEAAISPVRDVSGRIVNYVAVKRDVSQEVLLQRQLLEAQKMEALGTLAGGIAHDFNNLLQAILGYCDLLLLKKRPDDPDLKRLQVIGNAARNGADLVSRILTFSRKAEVKVRPMDLNDEILRAERLLRRTIPRMIEIKLVLEDNLQIIEADPGQVEQVLLNLAVNAHHAMPDGGQLLIETSNVSLSDEYLRSHLAAKAGRYVLLSVSDTGKGMAPEVMERAFEPFFTTKTNGQGTGLGLSTVHGVVTQHGGYIRCYSEPGRGTCFKIYLPVSQRELDSDPALTREMPAFGTETILLVDDDYRIREMGTEMIGMGGYKVLAAKSGEEALEIYFSQREEIALVILDLIMPGMGGKRCLEELLRIDPAVRVLVASGYSSNGFANGLEGSGARGFVSKPYDAKDILAAIRRVLDEGRM